MRVKLRKVGNSLTVTIPYEIVDELCLIEGMELDVVAREESVVLETPSATWERICEPMRKAAEERGITEDDIVAAVREMRRERAGE
jgi:antitoxin component of MazEF toxin-antitoxin module